jgi:peptidoglycan L-alanyl-D-glutamate endopeptidase CwlK
MQISANDEADLAKVHPDLVRVVRRLAKDWPHADKGFIITCGLRTLAEQKKLVAAGASKTMRSRHLPGKTNGLSHAVDFAVTLEGKVRWDWPLYSELARLVKAAAVNEKVPIEWGGDWKSFKDGPHFQLPWAKYPG